MMQDYPHIRASAQCPLCSSRTKAVEMLCCWRCYGVFGLRYGNPKVTPILDRMERAFSDTNPMERP